MKSGRTVGCKGCLAKMRGAVHAIHSDGCRARMQKEMRATDEGRRRVQEASERIEVHCRNIDEERAAKRVKHGEITEQASSSGGAPSHIETKEMDTEEQARAKRDHGCEHLEDGVKRARRMEHQADDDGDVLMELACTDDFEEHCELTTESEQEQKNVEDKVCWAEERDEPEFRDDRTGRPLDPSDSPGCQRGGAERVGETGVRRGGRGGVCSATGVRWVDVDKGFGVYRSRLVAKDFRPKSRVGDVEGLYAATLPLELVLGELETRSKSWNVRPSAPGVVRPSAPGVVKTRPEKASKWIKLTERKCLEQRDRAGRSASPETALVNEVSYFMRRQSRKIRDSSISVAQWAVEPTALSDD